MIAKKSRAFMLGEMIGRAIIVLVGAASLLPTTLVLWSLWAALSPTRISFLEMYILRIVGLASETLLLRAYSKHMSSKDDKKVEDASENEYSGIVRSSISAYEKKGTKTDS